MARLTILQASQQGFGSTLTIHRHIKDGVLPVYEDGDTKLLEVNDLIAVFGEPKNAMLPEAAPVAANGPADTHEVSRLRTELEQQRKKNMWLQADLAEAVREVKEKEAKFEKERNRLLTVLEQAQALLLREEGRIGPVKPGAADQKAAASDSTDVGEAEAAATEAASTPDATADNSTVTSDANDLSGIESIKGEDAGDDSTDKVVTSKMSPEQEKLFAPFAENANAESTEKTVEKESVNPLMPPLEDREEKAKSGRALGAMTWLLLCVLAGGGFVFFEYRTKVIAGVAKVIQAFS